MRSLTCCTSVALWVLGAADDRTVMVGMPKVERRTWKDGPEAAPTVDFTSSYHADPHTALGLELFAIPTLSLRASRSVVCALVLGAVAVGGYARAAVHCAYLHYLSHQATRSRSLCVNSSLRLAMIAALASSIVK